MKGPKAEFSTYDGSFYYLGVLFDQSIKSSHRLKNASFIIFWIGYVNGALILSWGYRGSLISFLSVPYVPPPMDTIKELANDPITVGSSDHILSFIALKILLIHLFIKLSERYAVYDYETGYLNCSKGLLVMTESARILDYNVRKRFTNKYFIR